ncbi:hypothetical protein [Edaphobacter flagellatus]|uniref:hypothetical protein n=1 Tax=Edaphobacter flagellatus TaxID=1933044 RepID=UPI0021B3F188|nr:hypothetical protein [Edaphobacter flagellatus]
MVLYDVSMGRTAFPSQSAMIYSIPVSQQGSQALIVMFSVNGDSGEASELLPHVANMYEGPLMLNARSLAKVADGAFPWIEVSFRLHGLAEPFMMMLVTTHSHSAEPSSASPSSGRETSV